jgi:hypothetical protein
MLENLDPNIAEAMTTQADGKAERDAGILMVNELTPPQGGRITIGADAAMIGPLSRHYAARQ